MLLRAPTIRTALEAVPVAARLSTRRAAIHSVRTLALTMRRKCAMHVAPAALRPGEARRRLSETPVPPTPQGTSLQDKLRDATRGPGGGIDSWLPTALVALGLAGGAYWYVHRFGAPPLEPPLEAAAAPFAKAKEAAEDIVAVVEKQIGPIGVDVMMDRLEAEMRAALKRFVSASGALYKADVAEIGAALERDNAAIRHDYEAAAVHIQTDYARAATRASHKDNPELVDVALEHARAQRDAHLRYLEEVRDYRLQHAQHVHDARVDAAKKCQAAHEATKSNLELALQKLVKAQRGAQRRFDADTADANGMVEQAKEDALKMATRLKYQALSKALVLKEQAEDAARRAEENAIAKAFRTRDALVAASEESVRKFTDAQEEYRDALLAAYAEVAEQKAQLAKANRLGKLDQAYLEAMKLADDTKAAALNAAEQTRQTALDGLEDLWQQAKEKASRLVGGGDDASYSQLGGIMNSLYALKSAAVDEVKRDTKAVLAKLGDEKRQIAKWYRDSVNAAISEYKKDTAAIQDKYNQAVKAANDKKGAAKEKALAAIQEQKEAELARAERVMKEAKDAANKSREYSDKQIAEMEAYFMDLDNP